VLDGQATGVDNADMTSLQLSVPPSGLTIDRWINAPGIN
jgi:hypothetical protein